MALMILATIIFIVAYALIISEKLPSAVVAILSAAIMIIFRIMTQEHAIRFIDFNTIGLLCGMMIMVTILKKTGIFEYLAIKAIKSTGGNPWRVLVSLSILTAVMSAVVDNVTTALIIVPITFAITDALKITPMPFLISEILFSNIGGTATLIGDPPNILIGNSAHIGFMDFIYHNTPVVVASSIFALLALRMIYKKDLTRVPQPSEILSSFDEHRAISDKKLLAQSLGIFGLVLLGFATHELFHLGLATVALGGSFALLLITNVKPEEVLKEIEWTTLFFFIGLFVLVGGLENTGVISIIATKLLTLADETNPMIIIVLWTSAIASTIVDNVPFTATMISIIKSVGAMADIDIKPLWWSLSLGACLGGNGTIIGASANIIVATYASKNNYPIRFIDFFKIGYPIMIGTIIIASFYMYLVHM